MWISPLVWTFLPMSSTSLRTSYTFPRGIYLLKVDNINTRTNNEICSKFTKKTPKRRHWRPSGVFNLHFEYISHLILVCLLLTLNMWLPAGLGSAEKSSMLISHRILHLNLLIKTSNERKVNYRWPHLNLFIKNRQWMKGWLSAASYDITFDNSRLNSQ